MNRDAINLTRYSTFTALNIAQMMQYRVEYVQNGGNEAEEKMYKHALFAVVGIMSLFTMGVLGLTESRRSDNRVLDCSW